MGGMIRTIVVLTLFCSASGFILSYLKDLTAPAIEEQLLVNVQGPAITSVFNRAENNPVSDRHTFETGDGKRVVVFPCFVGNRLTGVAIEGFGKGYGGDVGVIVGFNVENDSLAGVGMTVLKETPGLGMRVREPAFSDQFRTASFPVALSSAGGRIDAVSGATPVSGTVTYTWDCKGKDGKSIVPGKYKIFVEGTLRWKSRVLYTANITVGENSETVRAQPQYSVKSDNHGNMIGTVTVTYTP